MRISYHVVDAMTCHNNDLLVVCIHGLSIRRHLRTSHTRGTGNESRWRRLCHSATWLWPDGRWGTHSLLFLLPYISSRSTAIAALRTFFVYICLCCCLVMCFKVQKKNFPELELTSPWHTVNEKVFQLWRDSHPLHGKLSKWYENLVHVILQFNFSLCSLEVCGCWSVSHCSLLSSDSYYQTFLIFRTRHVLSESTKSDNKLSLSTKRQNNSQSRQTAAVSHVTTPLLRCRSILFGTRTEQSLANVVDTSQQDVDDEEAAHESTCTDTASHQQNVLCLNRLSVPMSLPFFWRSENHTLFCSIFQSVSHRVSPRTLVAMQYDTQRDGCRY